MFTIQVILFFYIILKLLVYIVISRKNNSWFNSFTKNIAITILIRMIPFLLMISKYVAYEKSIYVFIRILYVSTICEFVGYCIGSRHAIRKIPIRPQKIDANKNKAVLNIFVIIGIISFFILGFKGIGVTAWLTDSRMAYIKGRTGNGIFYVMVQLSIVVCAIYLMQLIYKKKAKAYTYVWIIIAAWFTGSKQAILGLGLYFIFFWDFFIKKIRMKKVVILGIFGFIAMLFLLKVQANINLLEYSDYYSNFLRFVDYSLSKKFEFYHGKLSWEQTVWSLIPRQLYPNKPHIYGHSRIISIFYPEEIILRGNTPSFSEFGILYADFGMKGIVFNYFFNGLFRGILEKYLKSNFKARGLEFNYFFTYCIFFVFRPMNFGWLFFVLFMILINNIVRLKLYTLKVGKLD